MMNIELPIAMFLLFVIGTYFGYILGVNVKPTEESHDCREPEKMIIETSNHSGSHLTTFRCSVCNKIVHQVVK